MVIGQPNDIVVLHQSINYMQTEKMWQRTMKGTEI